MRIPALVFLVSCPLWAGEYAILENGFRLRVDRHDVVGEITRLHTSTGTMEFASKQVLSFEAEEYIAPAPASVAVVIVAPAPVVATPVDLLHAAAEKSGLRPEFVLSVAAVESAFRTQAVSPKGAIGLMQLMPGTARDLGVNAHNPAENAEAGARYLKQLLVRYSKSSDPVRFALAAYNAGPGAVDRYREVPPYRETQAYVEKVLRKYLAELKKST